MDGNNVLIVLTQDLVKQFVFFNFSLLDMARFSAHGPLKFWLKKHCSHFCLGHDRDGRWLGLIKGDLVGQVQ